MKGFLNLRTLIPAVILLAVTMGAAAAVPGVTDDTIKIGMFAPLSGPAQSYGQDPLKAAQMWYKHVNKEGGIYGRKIDLVVENSACKGTEVVAAVKKLIEQDHVFMLNGGSCSSATVAAQQYIEQSNVPLVMLNASGDGALYPPTPNIYGAISVSQHAVGATAIEFVTDYFDASKIGYINHNDAYGAWNLEAAKAVANKKGVELIVQSVSPDITDVTAPILKMRAANPDVIVLTTYARAAALLIKKAEILGINVPIVLTVTGTANLEQLAENVGSKAALDNFYVQDVISKELYGEGKNWVEKMYAEYYPELAAKPGRPNPYMPYGVASAQTVVHALKKAGPKLTRDTLRKALENLHFDSIMAGPIDFGPNDHVGQESAIYLKYDGSSLKMLPGVYHSKWEYQPNAAK